ncbi:hypothetical protein PG991_014962 [Apiospora marii]|uniref:Uncharacterized protein n=1 Tax=Apiospora marii TaxID=335849 RepID=A0ABR1R308_9PEZI
MHEKLLLNLFYECNKADIELPWDRIAHRVDPGTTGEAVVQALTRLRQTCLAEGHLVPPELNTKDPWTRGLTRVYPDSFDEKDILYCRPVGWYEEVEHPKEKNPTAERLTFNGTHKFKWSYTANKAPVPDEWKEDGSKRKNEVRLSTADVIRMAKEEEQGQYNGSSSSSATHYRFAVPDPSSSTTETNTSDAFADDDGDYAEDDEDGMDYDEDQEDEEDEDGASEDETREVTPKLDHSHIDSRPNGRRMPRTNKASRRQSEIPSIPANSRGATPTSSLRGNNANGMAPKGYMRNPQAQAAIRNMALGNGLPPRNTMSTLDSPFTAQTMPQVPQPNIAHGLETSQD